MQSEPFRCGERLDQIVPDLAPTLVIVPPPEMQMGFQRQLDGASNEMKQGFARVWIARRSRWRAPARNSTALSKRYFPRQRVDELRARADA